jgi:ADP-dependent NAD(P)H-hydrate dehydratase / NAD(P)H-hydrate epimerase
MIPVLSRAEMRKFDAHASEVCAVPTLLLMENAARGAADIIARELGLGRAAVRRVVIVCGVGNNGGDGLAAARRLLTLGAEVRVFLLASRETLRGDALLNLRAFTGVGGNLTELSSAELGQLGQALENAHGVVDALFGTGLDREVKGFHRYAIEFLNGASCPRFALDIPSGIHADTGAVLGVAVRADLTITFGHHKLGLCTPTGAWHAGRVELVDLGAPAASFEQIGHSAEILDASDVKAAILPRAITLHKAAAGRVLVIAGSPGKVGAALLVALGALRAGAGLVTIAGLPKLVDVLDQRVLEVMTARIDEQRLEDSLDALLAPADAVAIGPGLGLDATARRIVDHVVLNYPGTKIVDADALTHFAGRAEEIHQARGECVLTPHSGEMARLLGGSAETVEADRFGAVVRAVELSMSTVLLKGAYTLIGAPAERTVINPTGTPVLATGGSGDVLCGVIAGLACGLDARRAACVGAYVHGVASERLAARGARDRGVLAHEIADEVPFALASLRQQT